MSAGTLTLTNNSAVVAGNGTAFTTEVAAGDFIVVTVGGVPYTLPIKSVESGTALTLVSNFTGPTQSGAAWSAVPRVALNMVTAALVAQSAEALRGLNYDKQNWQQVFSGTGNITVKLPDGTSYTGPAWGGIATTLHGKAGAGANSDITSLTGLTTALSVGQGGTGGKTAPEARKGIGLGIDDGVVFANIITTTTALGWGETQKPNPPSAYTCVPTENKSDAVLIGYEINNSRPDGYPTSTYLAQYVPNAGTVGFGVNVVGITGDNDNFMRMHTNILGDMYGEWSSPLTGSSGSFSYSKNATSDARVKTIHGKYDIEKSLENIDEMEFHEFTYNTMKPDVMRHGLIAQDLELIDPEYVHTRSVGDSPEFKTLDGNVLLVDALAAIQVLSRRLKALER
ncbi:TPA: tail fiber domain-containing protein [Citrobacter freundii]|nr:tail fiber domain-containing protein [Citrobacter freundii]HEE9870808.1 tail fiber domain-containing protein [Citrobacter freundii]HEE9887002.1 tail fiber domain-containing protein [Citrobacter freundii]HEE9977326.1 tail fiber domain-containing protein [Citrobacter freundii]